MVVPEQDIRAVGTADPLSDAYKACQTDGVGVVPGGPRVFGELFSFDDPEDRLPALDRFEGFVPGEQGLYRRVLIPVSTAAGLTVSAWAYAAKKPTGRHLPGGRWPAEPA